MNADDKPADAGPTDIGALERRLAKTLSEIRRMLTESAEQAPQVVEDAGEKRVATVH